MDKCIKILSLLFVQSLLCIGILYLYHHRMNVSDRGAIIIIDVKAIMKQELEKLAKMDLSEEQQKKALNRFSTALKRSLSELSLETKSTILLKDVVLEGGRDETETIFNKMHKYD